MPLIFFIFFYSFYYFFRVKKTKKQQKFFAVSYNLFIFALFNKLRMC